MNHTRIMLKLSGEAVWSTGQHTFDADKIRAITAQIQQLVSAGIQVAVVVGAGNIWRARDTEPLGVERVASDYLGMAATMFNASVMAAQLNQMGVSSVVHSAGGMHIPNNTTPYEMRSARQDLDVGKVVFCTCGAGNPYHTTDSGAVLRAIELGCSLVVKATKVDGIYDSDPMTNPDAVKFTELTLQQAIEKGLKIMDQTALALARDQHLPIFVCHMDQLTQIVQGLDHGTYVSTDS